MSRVQCSADPPALNEKDESSSFEMSLGISPESEASKEQPGKPSVTEDSFPTPESPAFETASLVPWNTLSEDVHVTGTLVWYFSICQRQCWLMSRQIVPDEDDPNIEFGRFLHKQRYQRERKEYAILGGKIDLVKMGRGSLLVAEVKKSSRYENAATNQILFYLKKLKDQGTEAEGELRIPEEKKRKSINLDEQSIRHITELEDKILNLVRTPEPPPMSRTRWCKNCGYHEFCWS